jgi:hypothetical protein
MRSRYLVAFLLTTLGASQATASVTEKEPNDIVEDSALCAAENGVGSYCFDNLGSTVFVTQAIDANGIIVHPGDPTNVIATPLSLTDEMVGQLHGPRDYDWYYLDVRPEDAAGRPETPVYFGCDKELGYLHEDVPGKGFADEDKSFRVFYYYDPDPATPPAATMQDQFSFLRGSCKRGDADTKGPLRFQMNTSRPGRHYIMVWGNLVETVKEKEQEDRLVNGEVKKVEITKYYDRILSPTALYTLRVYTAKTPGELEPNDGAVEAYGLQAGTTVTAQLSSMYDEDWFYIDNNATTNTANTIPFYFSCRGTGNTVYLVSTHNATGVVQSSYEIPATQCSVTGGFNFSINTPVSARYYVSVASPTSGESGKFTQSDYTLLAVPSGTNTNPQPDKPTRKDGELEPNEKPIDSFPLPQNVGVTAQLASSGDLDWFSFVNDATANTAGSTKLSFVCQEPSNSAMVFLLTAYNPQGVVQNNYKVGAAQCAATGGFSFNVNTPVSGTYFVQVSAPSDLAAASFSQRDFTVRWNPTTAANPGRTRQEGELEPNDRLVDAYPIADAAVVTSQLAAIDDLDLFYIDVDTTRNATGTTPIYFFCKVPADSTGLFRVSALNSQGTVQNSYDVSAAQCAADGGFRFELNTPVSGRYYVSVAGPADTTLSDIFSDANFTLSTFLNTANDDPITATGTLKKATIVDRKTGTKDQFNINLSQCGTNKGSISLTGKKLKLSKLDPSTQVKVQVGTWTCASDAATLTIDTSTPGQRKYLYPEPVVQKPKIKKPSAGGGG